MVLAAALLLAGCGGGAVAVRIGFAAHVVESGAAPAAGVQAGICISGGGGLALALLIAVAVAEGFGAASEQHVRSGEGQRPAEPARPLFQRIDRGWVDRGP